MLKLFKIRYSCGSDIPIIIELEQLLKLYI